MIIDPLSASKFIAVYKALLLEVDGAGHHGPKSNLLKRLVAARSRLSNDSALIDVALAGLKSKPMAVDPEVVAALRRLEVAKWIFLRDSTRYLCTRRSIGHTVSWGSTIESERWPAAWAWSLKLAWFHMVAGLFATASYRVFFGLEKTIDPSSIAFIKGPSRRAGFIRDTGLNKFEEF